MLPVVLRCDGWCERKVRYVFDSLFLSAEIPVRYAEAPPASGPWLLYATEPVSGMRADGALFVAHDPEAWRHFAGDGRIEAISWHGGQPLVFAPRRLGDRSPWSGIDFDLAANAFYFLSSWAERKGAGTIPASRRMYGTSEFARLDVPQDVVDRYLSHLLQHLRATCQRTGTPMWAPAQWGGGRSFAVVLSHDIDFLPMRPIDNAVQAVKSVLRHLVRQRDPSDAWRAARGWLAAVANGRDPYGCVPEIIERERTLGVRSSFQVAVGHRHPDDVNYRIEDDRVRDYLRRSPRPALTSACTAATGRPRIRSGTQRRWQLLARPLGAALGFAPALPVVRLRQLFTRRRQQGSATTCRWATRIHRGRAPASRTRTFPYYLREDRPYKVLQISLFLMDVTLRCIHGTDARTRAWDVIERVLGGPARTSEAAPRSCGIRSFSAVRAILAMTSCTGDMVECVARSGGLATDGRTIDNASGARSAPLPQLHLSFEPAPSVAEEAVRIRWLRS